MKPRALTSPRVPCWRPMDCDINTYPPQLKNGKLTPSSTSFESLGSGGGCREVNAQLQQLREGAGKVLEELVLVLGVVGHDPACKIPTVAGG